MKRERATQHTPHDDADSPRQQSHLKFLEIVNISWEEGKIPQIWNNAIMIPVYKKGKDRKKASSYSPISLTSCVVKTMDRIVNSRLMWYLKIRRILSQQQAGFRQFICTEDQATYLAQEIEDVFQDQEVVFASWIDLHKAFDKVWKDGLLVKLKRWGITNKMLRWMASYLDNRRARVLVDNQKSKQFLLRRGVPQEGVVSPSLFKKLY